MEFNRNAIQPVDCYRATWALIKPNYGLMLGICFVGMIIAGFGPFGLLLGPMMCGIFICFLRLQRGESVEFNTLFRGFDHFMPGFTVAFIQVLPLMLIQLPYLCWIMWLFFSQAMSTPRSSDPFANNPVFSSLYWIGFSVDMLVITVVGGVVQGLLVFGYGLVVERKMKGLDAAKLSARAALGNFGGVAAIIVINIVLSLVGLMLCYVGAILVIPLTLGVWTIAYRRVFPEPAADAAV
jgi:uncharacterized membrane protein